MDRVFLFLFVACHFWLSLFTLDLRGHEAVGCIDKIENVMGYLGVR